MSPDRFFHRAYFSVNPDHKFGEKTMKKIFYITLPWFLILISLVSFVCFAVVAIKRPLTQIEAIFLQMFTLLAGLAGSAIISYRLSVKASREIIKSHARSAFRRLVRLYESMSRMATIINASEPADDKTKIVRIEEIVRAQIATADDALADWGDLVPESVEELWQDLRNRGNRYD